MKDIKFENDKEELKFYREMKNKRTAQISKEIHEILDIEYEYPNGLYLLSVGKVELLRLKNAIICKVNQRSKE